MASKRPWPRVPRESPSLTNRIFTMLRSSPVGAEAQYVVEVSVALGDRAGRRTGHDRVRRDIACHHGPGADNSAFADGDARKDDGPGRDPRPLADGDRLVAGAERGTVHLV